MAERLVTILRIEQAEIRDDATAVFRFSVDGETVDVLYSMVLSGGLLCLADQYGSGTIRIAGFRFDETMTRGAAGLEFVKGGPLKWVSIGEGGDVICLAGNTATGYRAIKISLN